MSVFEKFSKFLTENKTMSKIAELLEFNGINMSLAGMLFTLYIATIIPRAIQAYDEHDRREILTRDLTSITLIVFGSRAIKKLISRFSSQNTGMALAKTEGCKTLDYFRPAGGVQVLSSSEVQDIYSNLNPEKQGLTSLLEFSDKNSGNVVKMLSADAELKKATETIMGQELSSGVSSKNVIEAFKKAHSEKAAPEVKDALSKIYKFFENPNNIFVKKGKGINAVFDLASTVAVIFLMIGLQFFNQYQTQKRVAQLQKEKAAKTVDFEKPMTNLKAPELEKVHTVNSQPVLRMPASTLKV